MSLQYKIGLVLCALLGVVDVVSVAGAGAEDGPPTPVLVLGLILGLITLVGVFLAWRGDKRGFIAVVVSRVISALSAVPVFFVDDVPDWAPLAVGGGIVVTAIALGLLVSGRRQAAASPLPTVVDHGPGVSTTVTGLGQLTGGSPLRPSSGSQSTTMFGSRGADEGVRNPGRTAAWLEDDTERAGRAVPGHSLVGRRRVRGLMGQPAEAWRWGVLTIA